MEAARGPLFARLQDGRSDMLRGSRLDGLRTLQGNQEGNHVIR